MEAREIIELVRGAVVQIATPYATGTGFYLKGPDLIITNEHVVRGCKRIVVDGDQFDKQLVRVLYTDPRLDIAFAEAPDQHNMPMVEAGGIQVIAEGETVIAVGHPFGLKYTATRGIISNANHDQGGIRYLQHDAALNPGNSGGPLLSTEGRVIGVNTFIIRDGNSIGFALPVNYLVETLDEYAQYFGKTGVRCHSCGNMVFDSTAEGEFCPFCGTKVQLPSQVEEYNPVGVKRTIESLLAEMGYNVELSRKGPNSWELKRGSANINISYHEDSGLIVGDAYLAILPRTDIKPIYEYLLRQNYELNGLTFSVQGQDIILSLLVYDRYLGLESGKALFTHLVEKADKFDNILVERFGALWKDAG